MTSARSGRVGPQSYGPSSRTSAEGRSPQIPADIEDKIGLLAQLVVTDGSRFLSIAEAKGSTQLRETRKRLGVEFTGLVADGRSPKDAYLELRNRHAPISHPLLVVTHESAPDLFFNAGSESAPDWKPDRVAFVQLLTRESRFAAPSDTFTTRGYELLLYSAGLYREGAAGHLHARIEDEFAARGFTATSRFVEEVIKSVARRSIVPRDSFNPVGFLNLANGVLEVATLNLHPHSPTRRFNWQIPVTFDAAADCPHFDGFLEEVLPRPRDRREVQKLFGYALGGSGNSYQCAHLFYGEGNNGKSTLLSVLSAILGKENVTAETLQSLTENKFSPAKLWGKLANIFADLPANPLRYTSLFKALTGGDKVRGEYKFGSIFYFVNSAKLIFSANELPEVNDRSRAFWRRWYLVRFDQDFSGREDRQLLERLFNELSGILNFAIAGLGMLNEDRGFLSELGTEDLLSEWKKLSDSLGWFIAETVDGDPEGWVPKQDFYEAYAEFCAAHRASAKTPEIVGKEIARHIPSIRTEQRRVEPGGPQVRGWRGLRIRHKGGGLASPASPASAEDHALLREAAEAGEAGEAEGGRPEQARERPELTPEVDMVRALSRFGLDIEEAFPGIRFHGIVGNSRRIVLVSRTTARQLGLPWAISPLKDHRPNRSDR